MNQEYFETPSLEIASYLQCKNIAVIDIKKQSNKTIFLFKNSSDIRNLVNQYYLKDKVSAIDHWNAIKSLKSRIYQ